MNSERWLGVVIAAVIGSAPWSVFAQASASTGSAGYLVDQRGVVARSGTNLCWRTSYWTPAMAVAECDPDLIPKPPAPPPPPPAAAPAPPPAPAPAPAPPPAAAPAAPKPITLSASGLFDFNKATLKPEARALIDREVLAKLRDMDRIDAVIVSGHSDRLGSAQYNQKLSERRAEAVKAYLVSQGVDANLIETYGYGKTQPVKSCDDKLKRPQLIACLEANRRVTVEVKGLPK